MTWFPSVAMPDIYCGDEGDMTNRQFQILLIDLIFIKSTNLEFEHNK